MKPLKFKSFLLNPTVWWLGEFFKKSLKENFDGVER